MTAALDAMDERLEAAEREVTDAGDVLKRAQALRARLED